MRFGAQVGAIFRGGLHILVLCGVFTLSIDAFTFNTFNEVLFKLF
jgi:hypothetical protein